MRFSFLSIDERTLPEHTLYLFRSTLQDLVDRFQEERHRDCRALKYHPVPGPLSTAGKHSSVLPSPGWDIQDKFVIPNPLPMSPDSTLPMTNCGDTVGQERREDFFDPRNIPPDEFQWWARQNNCENLSSVPSLFQSSSSDYPPATADLFTPPLYDPHCIQHPIADFSTVSDIWSQSWNTIFPCGSTKQPEIMIG